MIFFLCGKKIQYPSITQSDHMNMIHHNLVPKEQVL